MVTRERERESVEVDANVFDTLMRSRRQLVGISRQSITDVPVYTVKRPWVRRK